MRFSVILFVAGTQGGFFLLLVLLLFVVFCGKCHQMQAAGTKGSIGPNLDRDHVSYTNVVNAVVQGVGGIQAEYLLRVMKFQQLYDVAKFVTTQRR